eukprot:55738-Rhodomonas_salina.3
MRWRSSPGVGGRASPLWPSTWLRVGEGSRPRVHLLLFRASLSLEVSSLVARLPAVSLDPDQQGVCSASMAASMRSGWHSSSNCGCFSPRCQRGGELGPGVRCGAPDAESAARALEKGRVPVGVHRDHPRARDGALLPFPSAAVCPGSVEGGGGNVEGDQWGVLVSVGGECGDGVWRPKSELRAGGESLVACAPPSLAVGDVVLCEEGVALEHVFKSLFGGLGDGVCACYEEDVWVGAVVCYEGEVVFRRDPVEHDD